MTTEEEIVKNLKQCPRFEKCSINICPLDPETNLRNKLPEEETCPFTIKKKRKSQKGIRTLAPAYVLKVIPKSNVEMLSRGNQRRWHALR